MHLFHIATAPFTALIGKSQAALASAFHGLAAFIYLIVGTIGLYLGWRLFTGRIRAFADLQLLTTVSATLSLIAIVFGNWLYIFYRAKESGEPYTVDGRLIDGAAYGEYLTRVLPTEEDRALLAQLARDGGWIAPNGPAH